MNNVGSQAVGFNKQESGAALPMVLLMTLLLGTASIGLLHAVGASARNSTDVLSETKAYYAAESGIQAAVNVLRFRNPDGTVGGPMDYRAAVNNFANSSKLESWVTYVDCDPTGGEDLRVQVSGSCENGYRIAVRDPDNSQSNLSYTTSAAAFRTAGTNDAFVSPRQMSGSAGSTTIEWVPNTPDPTSLAFGEGTPSVNTDIGNFRVTHSGTTLTEFPAATEFQVFYSLAIAGSPSWRISGTIGTNGQVTFASAVPTTPTTTTRYILAGSEIQLCINSPCSVDIPLIVSGTGEQLSPLSARVTPKEPTRLLITSTGFGPNKASKKLEVVVQKSTLDGMNSQSPFTMNGPCQEPGNPSNTFVFRAGTSATTSYSGSSSGGVVMPAFAFSESCNLTTANNWIDTHLDRDLPGPGPSVPQVNPPAAYIPSAYLPEWQRTPQQMELKLNEWRAEAAKQLRYYNPHPGPKITDPGYTAGPASGVTFCEGNCTVDGDLGEGVLVVTGKLTSLGGFSFRGLILVTGPAGWERAGGGCGRIIGNVVISPYTAANLATNVFTLPPKYEITGAGCSGVEYASLDDLLSGENETFTNVVRGVAEK